MAASDQRGPPVIPVHPVFTEVIDHFGSLSFIGIEFYFELLKRTVLAAGIQAAAQSSSSSLLNFVATLTSIALGGWIAYRLGEPQRRWQDELTREQRLEPRNVAIWATATFITVLVGTTVSAASGLAARDLVKKTQQQASVGRAAQMHPRTK